jgi:hypothetical protein
MVVNIKIMTMYTGIAQYLGGTYQMELCTMNTEKSKLICVHHPYGIVL